MKRFLIACVMVGALSGGAATLLAHHSFAAEFDDKQPLKLTGTLTKVEWNNPHIWYYVDVKNPDGTTTTWGLSALWLQAHRLPLPNVRQAILA